MNFFCLQSSALYKIAVSTRRSFQIKIPVIFSDSSNISPRTYGRTNQRQKYSIRWNHLERCINFKLLGLRPRPLDWAQWMDQKWAKTSKRKSSISLGLKNKLCNCQKLRNETVYFYCISSFSFVPPLDIFYPQEIDNLSPSIIECTHSVTLILPSQSPYHNPIIPRKRNFTSLSSNNWDHWHFYFCKLLLDIFPNKIVLFDRNRFREMMQKYQSVKCLLHEKTDRLITSVALSEWFKDGRGSGVRSGPMKNGTTWPKSSLTDFNWVNLAKKASF